MREHLVGEHGCRGGYLRVNQHEGEEDFADVWPDLSGLFVQGGCPARGRDAVANRGSDILNRAAGIRVKELLIDLTECIFDSC